MTDDRLETLLRAALPPVGDADPSDHWSSVIERIGQTPTWSPLDVGLALMAAVVLLSNPEWLWLLAYHL